MLKGIPSILSPELLKILAEMGHGDDLVIADGNFPAASVANRLVRADGQGASELLRAILTLFPLDTYSSYPVAFMQVVPGDIVGEPAIWKTYMHELEEVIPEPEAKVELLERYEFYERAKKSYAVLATGETALYANIILKKGVVIATHI